MLYERKKIALKWIFDEHRPPPRFLEVSIQSAFQQSLIMTAAKGKQRLCWRRFSCIIDPMGTPGILPHEGHAGPTSDVTTPSTDMPTYGFI
ncbi:hypothetical protein HFO91_31790 [Rhizobium leguminosarum]|uniref:hypothetical protein n=1 Tax=Rhizobium leguminosarum TaxID=384 RepID=UPI001C97F09D|nr:hypothetical protein [Rhizobium leguminosarum]MBY5454157.1 hypothetical protein [Rhizobium leguminosarum]